MLLFDGQHSKKEIKSVRRLEAQKVYSHVPVYKLCYNYAKYSFRFLMHIYLKNKALLKTLSSMINLFIKIATILVLLYSSLQPTLWLTIITKSIYSKVAVNIKRSKI